MRRYVQLLLMVSVCVASGLVANAQNAGGQSIVPQGPADKTAKPADGATVIPLPARTVHDSVGVSATLLTHGSVRRIFGKEIANTYAVVQLVISNRNPDAAFVLHGAYLDISGWALGAAGLTGVTPQIGPYQGATTPNQIASVEARIARGQLLDAQTWSARNWTVRALTAAGSVASAVVFGAGENAAKYVAAFGGTVVPSVAVAWPDGSVGQLNRISDFGFQTNKVFPKESADIIVCFFPLDLFLSPGLRDIFVNSPGLFLSPYQILFTKENGGARAALGLPANPDHPKVSLARSALVCFPKPSISSLELAIKECPQPASVRDGVKDRKVERDEWNETLALVDYIGRFGAKNIPVIVDGIMTVAIDQVPAAIDDVSFDGDPSIAAFWATGQHKVILQCRFCSGGQVAIQEAAKLGIDEIKVLADESNEHKLTASFKLTKPIDTGTALNVIVTKPSIDAKKSELIKSAPRTYIVTYGVNTPIVTGVAIDSNKTVTLSGTSFSNTAAHAFVLSLSRVGGFADDKSVAFPSDATATTIKFAVPDGLAPGCWQVKAKWTDQAVSVPDSEKSKKILVAPAPTLTDAKRDADSIVLTGTQLADVKACSDKPVAFEVVDAQGKVLSPAPTATFDSLQLTNVKLSPIGAAKTGSWTVRISGSDKAVAVK